MKRNIDRRLHRTLAIFCTAVAIISPSFVLADSLRDICDHPPLNRAAYTRVAVTVLGCRGAMFKPKRPEYILGYRVKGYLETSSNCSVESGVVLASNSISRSLSSVKKRLTKAVRSTGKVEPGQLPLKSRTTDHKFYTIFVGHLADVDESASLTVALYTYQPNQVLISCSIFE